MASKHPELEKMRDDLLARKVALEAKSAPLRAERQKLRESITPTLDKLRELDAAIAQVEQPDLPDINRQLTGIVKAIGPKKMEAAA